MHSAGLELTKQTYFREDNLTRQRGDRRLYTMPANRFKEK